MATSLNGELIYSSPPDAFIAWHPEKGYKLHTINKVKRKAEAALESLVKDNKLDGWESKMSRIEKDTGWRVVPIALLDVGEKT